MRRTAIGLAVLVAALAASTTTAFAVGFSDPAALPRSLPGPNQIPGWEPSLSFDPSGDGHFYAVAPGGENGKGVGLWPSADNGATWHDVRAIGSMAGGFDSDVDTLPDHTVLVADLEAASSAICRSTDFGKTFDAGCESGQAQRQAGVEEDRQWLSHDPTNAKVVYFNYHDLALEYPILEKSTDGGQNFQPCGNLVDPSNPALFPSSLENTVVGKATIDKTGNIYVPIAAPTPQQAASSGSPTPPYGEIVVAYHNGCNGDQFANKQVYGADDASFANLFVSNSVGPDGALYVVASGQLHANEHFNTYVWVSRDGAKTFQGPFRTNSTGLTANVMSAISAGTRPGQVAVGWYGSSDATDPNDTKGTWRYYAATSDDYGHTWTQYTITPNVFHYGDICTVGIACTSGNRNLLDFSSIGVNPATGNYTVVFPGDPFDTFDREKNGDTDPAAAYISCQGGCGLPAKPPGGGTQQVAPQRLSCHDTTPPVSGISRRRSHFRRHGIHLRGIAYDRGCGPHGRGQIARETLAIARHVGKRCQWLKRNGRFGRKASCRHLAYVTARGTRHWSYDRRMRLRRGRYEVYARGIDAVGNIERPGRAKRVRRGHHNHYMMFRVR